MMLDADSQPLQDPVKFFEAHNYKTHGSLFWPDYQSAGGQVVSSAGWSTSFVVFMQADTGQLCYFLQSPQATLYELHGLTPPWVDNEGWMTTESGQFLIDRCVHMKHICGMIWSFTHTEVANAMTSRVPGNMELACLLIRHRHWDVIEWVVFVNLHHDITWKHMYGDKDSYELAFALADKLKYFSKISSWSRAALTPISQVRLELQGLFKPVYWFEGNLTAAMPMQGIWMDGCWPFSSQRGW